MKKLVLLAVTSVMAFAEANLYFGVDLVPGTETFRSTVNNISVEETESANALRIEGGIGSREGWGLELALDFVSYSQNIYDRSSYASNTVFDIDIVKGFDVQSDIYPFLKFGFGFGAMPISNASEESAANVSFQFGGGVFFAVDRHVDIDLGLMFRGRDWQDYIVLGVPVDVTSSAFEPHIGLNYRF